MNSSFVNRINDFITSLLNIEIDLKKYVNSIKSKRRHINEKQISFIAKSLGEIYKDGIAIKKALYLVEEIVSVKGYKESLKNIGEKISMGKSLSESFGEFSLLYPRLFVGFVFIGENTGKLYEILILLGDYYEKISFLKRKVKSACVYPSVILILITIMIAVIINSVVPNFYGIYSSMGITPSNSCKMIYEFRKNLKDNYIADIINIVCWIAILFLSIKCIIPKDKIKYMLKFKIIRDFLEYRMILIFSIITSSGVSILYGIDYCIGSMPIKYLDEKIIEIKQSIVEGNTLSEAFDKSGVFSNYSLAVIKVHEETGSLEKGFKDLSSRMEKEMYGKIKRYLKALEPAMTVASGAIVVIFLLAFVLPLLKQLQCGIRR